MVKGDFIVPFVMYNGLLNIHVTYFTSQERVLLTGNDVRTGVG